ncbi:DUF1294 domain-containing protein [Enterobacteriaceae bacterium C34A]
MSINLLCYGLLVLTVGASLYVQPSVLAGLLALNILTFLIYGADKQAARREWRRVPEITLLIFGLIGGWIGALFAQQLFRHKTQKQPFKTWFMLSVVVNVVLVAGLGYWQTA